MLDVPGCVTFTTNRRPADANAVAPWRTLFETIVLVLSLALERGQTATHQVSPPRDPRAAQLEAPALLPIANGTPAQRSSARPTIRQTRPIRPRCCARTSFDT